ncbi:hypothetical protein MT996_06555 [Ornithobacterium rhinotracheale]|uniref:hypothetical protein n=1 Tax=Ornithobacterium rhinotracheale TaxID=28251 RepID=UPI00129D02EC|nr:hypothetical protein [Ornithobacterium rhinotracheale]UOH76886.1 hypothetical protein MT996_06555 [Ornithobacterium rhinotracheale]
MRKILFLIVLFTFVSCNKERELDLDKKTGKVYDLRIDSLKFSRNKDSLSIYFTIQNNSAESILFPFTEQYPLFSTEQVAGASNDSLVGIFVSTYKNGEVSLPKKFSQPMIGFIDVDNELSQEENMKIQKNSINSYEEKMNKFYTTYGAWEEMNNRKIDSLKKNNLEYKKIYNWFFKHKYLLSEKNIIAPHSEKSYQIHFNNGFSQMFYSEISYKLDNFFKEPIDSISLTLYSDYNFIKTHLLLKKDLDFLNNKSIHIFNGKLKSNYLNVNL